jgi:hypothetical protein
MIIYNHKGEEKRNRINRVYFAYLFFFIAVVGFGCEIIDAIKEIKRK